MKERITAITVVCCTAVAWLFGHAADEASTDYLGQPTPGLEPKVFAEGLISTSARELNSVFSPDGRLFMFTRRDSGQTYRIMETRRGPDGWSTPSITSFTSQNSAVDPAVSWDGKWVFFGSDRPGSLGDSDIWIVEKKTGGEWGTPKNLGSPVNSPGNENHAAPARDGSLYFHSGGHPGHGESDIFRAEVSGEGYGTPVNLGPAVNSEASDFDPFVAPDESYLIFSSTRDGGFGGGDLHISFRTADGTWTAAVNMGDTINTTATDYCPKVSPDGRFLFYTSRSTGEGDVYWVDARILDRYRPH